MPAPTTSCPGASVYLGPAVTTKTTTSTTSTSDVDDDLLTLTTTRTTTPPLPPPVLFKTVNVTPVSGKVYV